MASIEHVAAVPQGGGTGWSARAWCFARHYLEMALAMGAGMAALGLVGRRFAGAPSGTALHLVEMAAWMTVPMVAWMRVRGHRWAACNEMAAAMLLPTAGALLLHAGGVDDEHALLMVQHVAMFPAMAVAMALRPAEHVGHHHHNQNGGARCEN